MFDPNSVSEVITSAKAAARSDAETARLAISVLDLTSLNDDDTVEKIEVLCDRGQSPAGNTAAVCVYAPFIETAWRALGQSGVKTATVVNFPDGGTNAQRVGDETADAVAKGADEVDLVLPYKAFLAGDIQTVVDVIEATRMACGPMTTMKVILESGEFDDLSKVYDAARLAIKHGANFVKTSTGKVPVGATPEAAVAMISAIRDAREEDGLACGFKASGGVKTTDDAALFLAIADEIMGEGWAEPATFRFGASGVLTALLETCGIDQASVPRTTGNY
ncbi:MULTISPECIES: deoxyribose-phosphate aldolase [Thalassospira]|jgi:deoxyribose-phosphate aldolase|uniref:Deoxyribose-phosphate aldolase n=2 Tax=Thalassospira xiamenensis TaxID=220697 RepID=A0ABR5XW22_9PROT|nr:MULTISPECIES: deoxyribose-phosphate aldolase [Thalassospira]MAL30941.1 deoxyribose-phosphate aldolase [Thalassospira sp.]MBR9778970.1 deoxyribose-phosphate aldolase [Rhodospirillales bacterium]KZC97031.1 2-deoxyribose-5-phosphate aldolase [Thalassospira xiamenensis]KZD08100.1 2-deoxyribose-5-phosphate aldolase [Thalassospira xiamenensis]MBL4843162.1 deoxyribose-phosphate aldolase [Thalassospira sp.]|tara:strand:+ start:504 stop:1337 length:834 start_codon:yes stop_codon:yes gene_type:complete